MGQTIKIPLENDNTLDICTDGKFREILYFHELPTKDQAEYRDMLDDDAEEGTFFKYRGWYYYLGDFMRFREKTPFPENWHGHYGESYFSGVIVELSDDGEWVKVGRYCQ